MCVFRRQSEVCNFNSGRCRIALFANTALSTFVKDDFDGGRFCFSGEILPSLNAKFVEFGLKKQDFIIKNEHDILYSMNYTL